MTFRLRIQLVWKIGKEGTQAGKEGFTSPLRSFSKLYMPTGSLRGRDIEVRFIFITSSRLNMIASMHLQKYKNFQDTGKIGDFLPSLLNFKGVPAGQKPQYHLSAFRPYVFYPFTLLQRFIPLNDVLHGSGGKI